MSQNPWPSSGPNLLPSPGLKAGAPRGHLVPSAEQSDHSPKGVIGGAAGFSTPRPEYPRPQFQRDSWLNLNGWWDFDQDPGDRGIRERWYEHHAWSRRIVVPYPVESSLSQVGDRNAADVVWYRRLVALPASFPHQRLLLHFGAVDYEADVWWDGQHLGGHEGGHTPFTLELPHYPSPSAPLADASHTLVVRAQDRRADLTQPRGKQYWKTSSESIFYTRTTGIWQTVWIEPVAAAYLKDVRCTPRLADGSIHWLVTLGGQASGPLTVVIDVTDPSGNPYGRAVQPVDGPIVEARLTVSADAARTIQPWSPESPSLYQVRYQLIEGPAAKSLDDVSSYLGFRCLLARDGRLWLNGQPYFLKMVLDQGYFPDGIMTARDASDLRRDVELAKAMGFNGVRKHQKVEDPLWLHWCDQLGLLVWGEMANAYRFTPEAVRRLTREWMEVVTRDYNHPAIVAWVPLNESWGVPDLEHDPAQASYLDALYALTKSLDATRLVVSNDGWEHTAGDLCTIHDYDGDPSTLRDRYADLRQTLAMRPSGKALFAPGYTYRGEPLLITEMGGVTLKEQAVEGWGYSAVQTAAELLARYRAFVTGLGASPLLSGFCYTELTDVEQEANGLLRADRTPKVDVAAIRQANHLAR